jgi:hypothetical protein
MNRTVIKVAVALAVFVSVGDAAFGASGMGGGTAGGTGGMAGGTMAGSMGTGGTMATGSSRDAGTRSGDDMSSSSSAQKNCANVLANASAYPASIVELCRR